jgi:hypothetical protein
MIRQYLSNTNESATIPILQKNLELNKALAVVFRCHLRDGDAFFLYQTL